MDRRERGSATSVFQSFTWRTGCARDTSPACSRLKLQQQKWRINQNKATFKWTETSAFTELGRWISFLQQHCHVYLYYDNHEQGHLWIFEGPGQVCVCVRVCWGLKTTVGWRRSNLKRLIRGRFLKLSQTLKTQKFAGKQSHISHFLKLWTVKNKTNSWICRFWRKTSTYLQMSDFIHFESTDFHKQ